MVAVGETTATNYLVLPFRSTEAQEAGDLSDRELETVAGGWDYNAMQEGCKPFTQGGC